MGVSSKSNSKSRESVKEGDEGASRGSKGGGMEAEMAQLPRGEKTDGGGAWPGTSLEAHSGSSFHRDLSRLGLGVG